MVSPDYCPPIMWANDTGNAAIFQQLHTDGGNWYAFDSIAHDKLRGAPEVADLANASIYQEDHIVLLLLELEKRAV